MKTLGLGRVWIGDLQAGIIAYLLTWAPVLCGILFAKEFLPQSLSTPKVPISNLVSACFHFDAFHYLDIVEHGYSYDPGKRSVVAFFPGYPLAGQIAALTGWDARLSLLVVANLMLLGTFVLFAAYLRSRFPQDSSQSRFLTLALFGLTPTGFFFRMPYSESMFLFLTLLAMVSMVRRLPLVVVALLGGMVTAVRPVGVAVTVAFFCHIILTAERGLIKRRAVIAIGFLPVACWGLIAYMTFQYVAFDVLRLSRIWKNAPLGLV